MKFSREDMGRVAAAKGLKESDRAEIRELMRVWNRTSAGNELREKYYLAHVRIKDLGIAIPKNLITKIDPRCNWPRKAVHALADRSVFNGFTSDDEKVSEELRAICADNSMERMYRKNVVGELKHCCGFWDVTSDPKNKRRPIISAYPATAAVATWSDDLKAIRSGLVIVESKPTPGGRTRKPTVLRLYTSDAVTTIRLVDGIWRASRDKTSMGRPLMEPMPYAATLERPFGSSRISREAMSTTDAAIRQMARMEVAAESSTLPQMWLLGTASKVTNDGNKYDASMGAINEITKDEDGDSPNVWQSAQLQMQPLNDYMRTLQCQMSQETNVPVSFFGVASDNPSSEDAINASLEPLIIDAKNLNKDNSISLRNVALMALAVAHGTDFATEEAAGYNINPRFMQPAYPSIASLSDAVLKQVEAVPALAESDVLLEMLDYSDEQIQRIESARRKSKSREALFGAIAEKMTQDDGASDADSTIDA